MVCLVDFRGHELEEICSGNTSTLYLTQQDFEQHKMISESIPKKDEMLDFHSSQSFRSRRESKESGSMHLSPKTRALYLCNKSCQNDIKRNNSGLYRLTFESSLCACRRDSTLAFELHSLRIKDFDKHQPLKV